MCTVTIQNASSCLTPIIHISYHGIMNEANSIFHMELVKANEGAVILNDTLKQKDVKEV